MDTNYGNFILAGDAVVKRAALTGCARVCTVTPYKLLMERVEAIYDDTNKLLEGTRELGGAP